MRFPLINISEEKWNAEELIEYFDFDGYFYSSNTELYKRYIEGKEYCDCNGDVYQVVDKIPPKQWWRRVFRFIPDFYREKLIFKKTGKRLELDELRKYVSERVRDLSEDDFTRKWIFYLKNAASYEEVINGKMK